MPSAPGAYRRAIAINNDDGVARAEMEDDIHHFGVTVWHDGARILSAEARSVRTPWTTCAGAGLAIAALAGHALSAPLKFSAEADRTAHCTHMLDLANLAIAHARENGFHRFYRIEVDYDASGDARAWLERNEKRVISWVIGGGRVVGRTGSRRDAGRSDCPRHRRQSR